MACCIALTSLCYEEVFRKEIVCFDRQFPRVNEQADLCRGLCVGLPLRSALSAFSDRKDQGVWGVKSESLMASPRRESETINQIIEYKTLPHGWSSMPPQ